MNVLQDTVLPAEILSQVLYQCVLLFPLKQALALRSVSAYFDMEVIRAVLFTKRYRPEVRCDYELLMAHFIRKDVENGTVNPLCERIRRIDAWMNYEFPSAQGTPYLERLAEAAAYRMDFKCLLEHGSDAPCSDMSSQQLLQAGLIAASACNKVDIIEELISRGARADGRAQFFDAAVDIATYKGNEDALRMLIRHGAILDPVYGWSTLLSIAATHGHSAIVQYLLSPENLAKYKEADLDGVLWCAIYHGHRAVKDALYAAMQVKTTLSPLQLRYKILWKSARYGRLDFCKECLTPEMDLDAKDYQYHTALMYAAGTGQLEGVKFLLDSGCDINLDGTYGPPLCHAAMNGHVDVCELLIKRGATDLKDAFRAAEHNGYVPVMRLLIRSGLREDEEYQKVLVNALSGAAMNSRLHLVEYLVDDLGVRPNCDDVNAEDNVMVDSMHLGQRHVFEALVKRGFPCVDLTKHHKYGWIFAEGLTPHTSEGWKFVRAIEDRDAGHNVQIWAQQ